MKTENSSCVFCEERYGRERMIYADQHFISLLCFYAVSPGHTLIIPRRHVASLSELSDLEWNALKPALEGSIAAIESYPLADFYRRWEASPFDSQSQKFCLEALSHPALGRRPDAYNHGVNQGAAAGQTISHLHWHLIPRYLGDVPDPVGGVRHIIPGMGNYKAQ